MTTIENKLVSLHEFYAEAVNIAVSHDDFTRVDRLAAEYDAEALILMREAQDRIVHAA